MFGNVLQNLLKENDISQSELSRRIGYTQRAVSKWINNQSEPTEGAIKKCALVLGVTADYLLGLEDDFGNITIEKNSSQFTDEEQKLVDIYNTLDDDTKATLWALLETWKPFMLTDTTKNRQPK